MGLPPLPSSVLLFSPPPSSSLLILPLPSSSLLFPPLPSSSLLFPPLPSSSLLLLHFDYIILEINISFFIGKIFINRRYIILILFGEVVLPIISIFAISRLNLLLFVSLLV